MEGEIKMLGETNVVEGVKVRVLKKIINDKGRLLKMLESTDSEFTKFGEIYFSTINPGVVKGWDLQENTTKNYAVVKGNILLVIYDSREGSNTFGQFMEILIGDDNYSLVQIPPKVWSGFKCIGKEEAIVADLIDIKHDPKTAKKIDPYNNNIIKYDWSKQ